MGLLQKRLLNRQIKVWLVKAILPVSHRFNVRTGTPTKYWQAWLEMYFNCTMQCQKHKDWFHFVLRDGFPPL